MRPSSRGVSLLLEALLGLGIFAVSILVVLALIPGGHDSLNKGKNRMLATVICRDVLDQRKARAYDAIVTEAPFPLVRGTRIDGNDVNSEFTVTVSVAPLTAAPYESKDLLVGVEWTESESTRRVQIETIVVR